MLVDRFNCPECDAVLKPKPPVPAGRRIKCPACATLIKVPTPRGEEAEEVEPVEEVEDVVEEARPKRKSGTRGPDEEEHPSRRAYREEEEEDRPRRRRGNPARGEGGGPGLKVALVAGAALLLLVGLGVGGFLVFGPKSGQGGLPPDSASTRSAASPLGRLHVAAAETLATVRDESTARAAQPRLVELGGQIRADYQAKVLAAKNLNVAEIQQKIAAAAADPDKHRAEVEQEKREREADERALGMVIEELIRVKKVPGGKPLLDAFYAACGEFAHVMRVPAEHWGR